MEEKTVLERYTRVIFRALSEAHLLTSVFYNGASEADEITGEVISDVVDMAAAAKEVCAVLIDIVQKAYEGGAVPEEVPLPFESLESMDDRQLRTWMIAKIEAKAGKELFYE